VWTSEGDDRRTPFGRLLPARESSHSLGLAAFLRDL